MDHIVAELGAHAAQTQHHIAPVPVIGDLPPFRLGAFGHQTPASRKMTEKIASSTITQKIDSTTAFVVS